MYTFAHVCKRMHVHFEMFVEEVCHEELMSHTNMHAVSGAYATHTYVHAVSGAYATHTYVHASSNSRGASRLTKHAQTHRTQRS